MSQCYTSCRTSTITYGAVSQTQVRRQSSVTGQEALDPPALADTEDRARGAKGAGMPLIPVLISGVKMSSKPSNWLFDITGGRRRRKQRELFVAGFIFTYVQKYFFLAFVRGGGNRPHCPLDPPLPSSQDKSVLWNFYKSDERESSEIVAIIFHRSRAGLRFRYKQHWKLFITDQIYETLSCMHPAYLQQNNFV